MKEFKYKSDSYFWHSYIHRNNKGRYRTTYHDKNLSTIRLCM